MLTGITYEVGNAFKSFLWINGKVRKLLTVQLGEELADMLDEEVEKHTEDH